jgi:hypothetical protein
VVVLAAQEAAVFSLVQMAVTATHYQMVVALAEAVVAPVVAVLAALVEKVACMAAAVVVVARAILAPVR